MCLCVSRPFTLHPLPPTFPLLSAGLWEQVGRGTKPFGKENHSACETRASEKRQKVSFSFCAKALYAAAESVWSGAELLDLTVCCGGAGERGFVCSCCFLHEPPFSFCVGGRDSLRMTYSSLQLQLPHIARDANS